MQTKPAEKIMINHFQRLMINMKILSRRGCKCGKCEFCFYCKGILRSIKGILRGE